jgi:hypothetical protein
MALFCRNCGSAIVGGSRFCANCGATTDAPAASSPAAPPLNNPSTPYAVGPAKQGMGTGAKLLLAGLVIVLVGGLAIAAGAYYVVKRVSQKVHSLSRSMERRDSADSQSDSVAIANPCRLLSSRDVGLAAKVEIVGTQAEGTACSYLAKGDEADMASRHATAMVGAKGADLNTQKTIQQFSGGLFKALQNERPEEHQDAKGTVPVFSFSVEKSENAEAEMTLNSKVLGGLGPGSEHLTGIGDEAFVAGDSMIMVRKGDNLIRIMYMTCPCGTAAIKPLARKIADSL